MSLNSNIEWKRWAKADPLWAVSAWPNKAKGAVAPWSDDEFYAFGEADWQDFHRHWRQYGVRYDSCLELGCGAGRLTRPLAAAFDKVYAVDVAQDMLDYVRSRLAAGNVTYFLTDGLHLPQNDGSVTAVFSTHVFQHLDSARIGFLYFKEAYRVLAAGGTIMVHLPVYRLPYRGRGGGMVLAGAYGLLRRADDAWCRLRRGLGGMIMRNTQYEIEELCERLIGLGYKRIEVRVVPTASNGHFHPFVLAAK